MNGHSYSNGWTAYNEKSRPTYSSNASWLASRDSLPIRYDDDEKNHSWIDPSSPLFQQLNRLRRSLIRKIPFVDSLIGPRRFSITSTSSDNSSTSVLSGDTIRFVLLCSLWYMTSALSSNTGKVILNQFKYPVTLTFVQFGYVAAYCLLFMSPVVRFSTIRRPTKAIIHSTFPMGCFQVGGHIFSSMAISRIPVSTVHTIKALSPLFTVAAYALLFGVSYSSKTYLSLLPLTIGVMLACSFDVSTGNSIGLVCAFGSAIVFVTQNIFFKKIMPSNAGGSGSAVTNHKLDKVNLLFYSSGMAFLLMVPIWVYYDLPHLLASEHSHPQASFFSVAPHFFINGTVHFAQNVLAFVILAKTSPVTYSIASLIKRVAVICIAVVWFKQSVHMIQGVGIALTFFGLYCYNGAKSDVERGEKKVRRVENARDGMLPSTIGEAKDAEDSDQEWSEKTPVHFQTSVPVTTTAYTRPRGQSIAHAYPHPAPPLPPPPHRHPTAGRQNPDLHIHIAPRTPREAPEHTGKESGHSPTKSYPSPPPSEDSPPDSPTANGHASATATPQDGESSPYFVTRSRRTNSMQMRSHARPVMRA